MSKSVKGDPTVDAKALGLIAEVKAMVKDQKQMKNLDLDTLKQLQEVSAQANAQAQKYITVRLEQSIGYLKGLLPNKIQRE